MRKLISALVCMVFGCAAQAYPPLPVVERVDISRYMGVWHEIARYPNRFQEGCYGSFAEYSLNANGTVKVINRCRDGSPDGEMKEAEGIAKIVDTGTNAKLKVSFFRPFYGNYWIIELGESYEYVVVSEPKRKYLWILARTPQMEQQQLQGIFERLTEKGFDTKKLLFSGL